jgi:glycine/D-amino acid oxidase-like deaminating enzyme
MSKSWKADEIFSYLFDFYRSAETLLNEKFFHERPIYRPFVSVEEQNEWMALSENPSLGMFIEKIVTEKTFEALHDPFGGVLTKRSGYLDVNAFLGAVREFLKKENTFQEDFFDASHCTNSNDGIDYKDYEASSAIFCEGFATNKNLFFGWLPVRPLKGETLSVSIDLTKEIIFNRGVYLVPLTHNNSFTLGATYLPNNSSEGVSEEGKTQLEEKLKELTSLAYEVSHQNWGIRPTTPDRRPILGRHPAHKNIIVFNGLGTKGVSLAPYFSKHLTDWLEGKAEILNEVNIERFKALYSKFSSL